jgi:hypothetical protein
MGPVATCDGYELIEDGPRLVFVDRRIGLLSELRWLLPALSAMWTLGATSSALQCAFGPQDRAGRMLAAALACSACAVLALLGWLVATARRRARLATPWTEHAVVGVIDRGHDAVLDGAGAMVARMSASRLRTRVRLTSRGKTNLELVHPGGVLVLAREPTFARAHAMVHALEMRGFPFTHER